MKNDWLAIVFLVFVGIERLYERRYNRQAMRGERKIGWSYTTLHSLYLVIFFGAAVEHFWLRRSLDWLATGAGLGLYLLSLVIRLIAIRGLGRFWSLQVEIRQEHRLVREGIYQYVRHPAYLAMMLEIVAIPLVVNSYYTAIFAIGAFVPALLVRWRYEERELVRKFGDVYVQYQREVGAFFPNPRTRRRGPGRDASAP